MNHGFLDRVDVFLFGPVSEVSQCPVGASVSVYGYRCKISNKKFIDIIISIYSPSTDLSTLIERGFSQYFYFTASSFQRA